MLAPSLPINEECRIASLRALNILDTEPEERFDRVTRLSKRLFDVPIALVSLIDSERQWFKSVIGISDKQTPRSISFCGHAIHHHQTFIVEDAHQDQRFVDNPLVTGPPNIRFYAGHPITAPNKDIIGTLCIIDTKARKFTDEDVSALSDLAALVTDEFVALQLATMDDLTNVTNRRGFLRLGQHCINICARQKGNCHLAYFDLNHFKSINDNYGHCIGDKVLKIFAQQMLSTFRASDICARLGGDEFVVLLTNTQLSSAQAAIKRFSESLIKASKALAIPHTISFAYGIASYKQGKHVDIEQLITQADHEMYQNKRDK